MSILSKGGDPGGRNHFRFSLAGLIVFSLALVAGTGLVATRWLGVIPKSESSRAESLPGPDPGRPEVSARTGPWGELLTQAIDLERPEEYVVGEANGQEPETWRFEGMGLAEVMAIMTTHGLTLAEAEALARPDRLASAGKTTVLTPDEDSLLGMKPETRGELYAVFYGKGVSQHLDYPCVFPGESIEAVYEDPALDPADVALMKKLVYPAGTAMWLSDYPLLLRRIPTAARRVSVARALSRQPAVLARLHVRPDSDIDKIAAYWGRMDNVRQTDLRPMLAALKELPHGGMISVMYLLPPFARTHLYTYPLPDQPNEPAMDCHWTTFNFSRREPDNRFADTRFTAQYLVENYYRVDAPSLYGDVVMYANGKNEVKHSAVYLADDLAYTKYGNNYRQPWMIVRMADMQALYPGLKPIYYRKKSA